MIQYKTPEQIEIMREGGQRLKRAVAKLRPHLKKGTTTEQIDTLAEKCIREEGGESSFKRVPGYRWTTCTPINEQVVHTPPGKRMLKDGDILSLDIGMFYKGFHTDYSDTVIIGSSTKEKELFLDVGRIALQKAIKKAVSGNRLGDISEVIQSGVEGAGFHIMKELTGHGVGKDLHEEPYVFGYLDKPVEKTLQIKPGLVIAIEVIYAKGTEDIAYEKDNDWSIISADRSLTACFEHTVAITEKGTIILT